MIRAAERGLDGTGAGPESQEGARRCRAVASHQHFRPAPLAHMPSSPEMATNRPLLTGAQINRGGSWCRQGGPGCLARCCSGLCPGYSHMRQCQRPCGYVEKLHIAWRVRVLDDRDNILYITYCIYCMYSSCIFVPGSFTPGLQSRGRWLNPRDEDNTFVLNTAEKEMLSTVQLADAWDVAIEAQLRHRSVCNTLCESKGRRTGSPGGGWHGK